jgi:hypothetical protein
VQQNSFNPKYDNSDTPTIWHLRKVVPRLEVLLFTRIKALPMEQADLRDMFKKAYICVCISTNVVSPDSLSPITSGSSYMRTS